jgi:hypothetical protein
MARSTDVYPRDIRVNNGPAIYSFLSKVNGNYHVLYIGQTIDLSERLANHHKWDEAIRHGFEYLAICRSVTSRDLDRVEATLIQRYRPRCNEVVPR